MDNGIKVYIKKSKSNNATNKNKYLKDQFAYRSDQDIYICPMGKELAFYENTSKYGIKYTKYKCAVCAGCPQKELCTTSASGGNIQRWEHEAVLGQVDSDTKKHNHIYKQRRNIAEHPFGTIKRTMGYTYFLRKGIENVDAESASIFIAYNLKRLFGVLSVEELKKKYEVCRV